MDLPPHIFVTNSSYYRDSKTVLRFPLNQFPHNLCIIIRHSLSFQAKFKVNQSAPYQHQKPSKCSRLSQRSYFLPTTISPQPRNFPISLCITGRRKSAMKLLCQHFAISFNYSALDRSWTKDRFEVLHAGSKLSSPQTI